MYSIKDLEQCRQEGDPLADRVVKGMYEDSENTDRNVLNSLLTNSDLLQVSGVSEELQSLIEQSKIPAFAEPGQIEEAKAIFKQYSFEIIGLLGIYSLPYCYAAANGSKVLIHSRNLLEHPEKRLSETAQFVVDIFEDQGFEPQGRAFLAILKVRLLHATARYFAGKYIVYEKPVNQEDMAGTNLAFSLICLRGMQNIGIDISTVQKESYIHFWNVIGALLGIKKELLPTGLQLASALERAIRKHQFRFSEEGKVLTASLTGQLQKQMPGYVPVKAEDFVAFFLGDKVAKCVGLSSPGQGLEVLFSAVKLRNFLRQYTEENYQQTVELIRKQVQEANGSYFTI